MLGLVLTSLGLGIYLAQPKTKTPGPEYTHAISLYENALGATFDTASTGPEFDPALEAFERVPRSDPKYSLAQTFVAEIKAGRAIYAGGETTSSPPPVTIYTRSDCGYCLRAVDWMNNHNIDFVEVDLGNNRVELRKLHEKARANNVQLRGVPVFEINSEIMQGFSSSKLESSLKTHGYL